MKNVSVKTNNSRMQLNIATKKYSWWSWSALWQMCVCCTLTDWAVDARVLVITEEEAIFAAALVAAHGVYTNVLAPTVVELAFIHI